MKLSSSSSQAGFSLIELILVIIILGVLAVTAAPRFVDIQDDAQAASVQGVGTAFGASVRLARLKWQASGYAGAVDDLDVFGNGERLVDFNVYGWPVQSYWVSEESPVLDNSLSLIHI